MELNRFLTWEDKDFPKGALFHFFSALCLWKIHVPMGTCWCLDIFHKEYLVKPDRGKTVWFIEYYFLILWILAQVYVNHLANVVGLLLHAFISPAMQDEQGFSDNQMVKKICSLSSILNYSENSVYKGNKPRVRCLQMNVFVKLMIVFTKILLSPAESSFNGLGHPGIISKTSLML